MLRYSKVNIIPLNLEAMKAMIGLLALMATFTMQAQITQPVFQKEGNTVKATYFHDNGAIAQVGAYVNGKLHGDWIMYDAQGNKQAIGQYDNGVKVGKWFFWDEEGLKEVDYRNNQIAQVVKWNNGESVVLNK